MHTCINFSFIFSGQYGKQIYNFYIKTIIPLFLMIKILLYKNVTLLPSFTSYKQSPCAFTEKWKRQKRKGD